MADQTTPTPAGAFYELSVIAEDGSTITGYLGKPQRPHIARSMSQIAQNQVYEAGEYLLENLFIADGSDPRILSDEDVKMAAAMQAIQAVKTLDGSLKKV